jgi:hypothetical protein
MSCKHTTAVFKWNGSVLTVGEEHIPCSDDPSGEVQAFGDITPDPFCYTNPHKCHMELETTARLVRPRSQGRSLGLLSMRNGGYQGDGKETSLNLILNTIGVSCMFSLLALLECLYVPTLTTIWHFYSALNTYFYPVCFSASCEF